MILGGSALVVEFLAPDLQRFDVQPGFQSSNQQTMQLILKAQNTLRYPRYISSLWVFVAVVV